jgi:hypothetical protein
VSSFTEKRRLKAGGSQDWMPHYLLAAHRWRGSGPE